MYIIVLTNRILLQGVKRLCGGEAQVGKVGRSIVWSQQHAGLWYQEKIQEMEAKTEMPLS